MKSWFLLLLSLWLSWHFMDMGSESGFYSMLLPILFMLLLIALALKVAFKLGPESGDGCRRGGISDFLGGGDSGGGDCS